MKVETSDRPWRTTLPQILISFSRKRALVRRKKPIAPARSRTFSEARCRFS
jgi:hypothetical protein